MFNKFQNILSFEDMQKDCTPSKGILSKKTFHRPSITLEFLEYFLFIIDGLRKDCYREKILKEDLKMTSKGLQWGSPADFF